MNAQAQDKLKKLNEARVQIERDLAALRTRKESTSVRRQKLLYAALVEKDDSKSHERDTVTVELTETEREIDELQALLPQMDLEAARIEAEDRRDEYDQLFANFPKLIKRQNELVPLLRELRQKLILGFAELNDLERQITRDRGQLNKFIELFGDAPRRVKLQEYARVEYGRYSSNDLSISEATLRNASLKQPEYLLMRGIVLDKS